MWVFWRAWFIVIGLALITLSAFPRLKINQAGVHLWNLGWGMMLAGLVLVAPGL